MSCHQLAERISGLRSEFFAADVARLTFLIFPRNNDERLLSDDALDAE